MVREIPIRYGSIRTIAKLADTSPRTVRSWVKAGLLPVSRLPSGHYRIKVEDLDDLMDSWKDGEAKEMAEKLVERLG